MQCMKEDAERWSWSIEDVRKEDVRKEDVRKEDVRMYFEGSSV